MKVNCDKCNKLFKVMPKQKKHGQGIRETYFTCPYCEEHYTSYITDREVRKWQKEAKKIRRGINRSRNEDEIKGLINKFEKVKRRTGNRMDELKDKVLNKKKGRRL